MKRKHKRRFATYYYTDEGAPVEARATQGSCKTEDGAKRATAVRLVLDQYVKAVIFDRAKGVAIWTFTRTSYGVRMALGSATQLLRRIK